ncbi:MAG TPA: phospholipase, partial [Flavobacteriaceae bacterium]|nr:phospholipase [Flavobacteriaceae bacterium]
NKLYRKLKRKGIETKWTLYPGVDHNSWDLAFEEQELIPWLNQ